MKQEKLDEILAKHQKWLNNEPGGEGAHLERAHLERAHLEGANLAGANLKGAHLDYSCWPLWCGSKGVIVDVRIAAQLAAHGAVVEVNVENAADDEKRLVEEWQSACLALGKLSHRAEDLGLK